MTSITNNPEQELSFLVFRLQALVLALGESADPAWWKTGFMNETGLRFLERIYPRTFLSAAVCSAGKAASNIHDRAVGRIGAYHLFRLPESLENEISRMPLETNQAFLSTLRDALGRPERLMELLIQICGRVEREGSFGARRMGTDRDLMTIAGIKKTAAVYYQAFMENKLSFPYFTIEQSGDRI